MPLALPATFGKYQLLGHLAEGGMADVYQGRLPGPGGFEKRLVVKVIRPELAQRREFCELFVAEAKITVALSHANIVPVYELGMVDGQYFLAMELVDGPPLHQLVFDPRPGRGGPLPPQLAAYVMEQVLRGLDYAHQQGVIHRDLSPANILCSRSGEVKIVDFGIAAQAHAAAPVGGGSEGYIAPEQRRGLTPTPRVDVYAAGVVLAEMLSGQRFVHVALDLALPPRSSPQDPALPAALARIVRTATQEDPAARYATAAAMLVELGRFLREGDVPTQGDLASLVRRRAPDERRSGAFPLAPSRHPRTGPRTRELPPPRPSGPSPAVAGEAREHTPRVPIEALTLAAEPTPTAAPAPAPKPLIDPPAEEVGRVTREQPPDAGVVIFASRPAPVHATWRTYLGAASLLGIAGALLWWLTPLPAGRPAPQPPQPLPYGFLHVDLPRGAALHLDGQPLPPRVLGSPLQVPIGSHRIEARAPGHRPLIQIVDIRPGETLRERLVLPWALGHLQLLSTPPGAQVELNGVAMGVTPLDLDVPVDRASTLRLSAPGYQTAVREVPPSQWVLAGGPGLKDDHKEGEEAQPELRMSVALSGLQRGSLTVGALPWAQVFIDGERRGDTPLRRLPLPAGPHALRLYCPPPGCPRPREYRQQLLIEPGREQRRVVDFHSDPPSEVR